MDTSGESALSIVLDIVVLALFVGVSTRPLWSRALRRPWPAVAAVVVVGVPSLLQFAWPALGSALMREPGETLRHGEWWRVLTALLAQDGGIAAAVFNLLVVAIVMLAGNAVWGWWRAALLFLGISVVLNLAALAWQPGGGTSFASDGLLMASSARLALDGARARPGAAPGRGLGAGGRVRMAAAVQLAAGVVLIAAGDAHGVALVLGFAVGALLPAPSACAAAGQALPRPARGEAS